MSFFASGFFGKYQKIRESEVVEEEKEKNKRKEKNKSCDFDQPVEMPCAWGQSLSLDD